MSHVNRGAKAGYIVESLSFEDLVQWLEVDPKPVAGDVIEALKNYEIRPVLWGARAEVVAELAA